MLPHELIRLISTFIPTRCGYSYFCSAFCIYVDRFHIYRQLWEHEPVGYPELHDTTFSIVPVPGRLFIKWVNREHTYGPQMICLASIFYAWGTNEYLAHRLKLPAIITDDKKRWCFNGGYITR